MAQTNVGGLIYAGRAGEVSGHAGRPAASGRSRTLEPYVVGDGDEIAGRGPRPDARAPVPRARPQPPSRRAAGSRAARRAAPRAAGPRARRRSSCAPGTDGGARATSAVTRRSGSAPSTSAGGAGEVRLERLDGVDRSRVDAVQQGEVAARVVAQLHEREEPRETGSRRAGLVQEPRDVVSARRIRRSSLRSSHRNNATVEEVTAARPPHELVVVEFRQLIEEGGRLRVLVDLPFPPFGRPGRWARRRTPPPAGLRSRPETFAGFRASAASGARIRLSASSCAPPLRRSLVSRPDPAGFKSGEQPHGQRADGRSPLTASGTITAGRPSAWANVGQAAARRHAARGRSRASAPARPRRFLRSPPSSSPRSRVGGRPARDPVPAHHDGRTARPDRRCRARDPRRSPEPPIPHTARPSARRQGWRRRTR